MANDFSPSIAEYWAARMQRDYTLRNVTKYITNSRFEEQLSDGDTFHRQYDDSYSQELDRYTTYTDIAVDDVTNTDETLVIDQKFARARQFDKFDITQVKPDVIAHIAENDGIRMQNHVDSSVLGEYANATSNVDDGDMSGGTSGNGINPGTGNILEMFSVVGRKLDELNIPENDRWAVISPKVKSVVYLMLGLRETPEGDKKIMDGNLGISYAGFKLFVSNQLTGQAVLSMATQPTNGDTITINGVTFTFVSSIGSTAGNVLIGADVDTTRASLAALINAPSTTAADRVGWSTTSASQKYTFRKLRNRATATNDNTANTLTVTWKGLSKIVVSETLTAAADTWTALKTITHNLFGQGMEADAPIDLVMQIRPMVEVTPVPLQFGQYVKRGMYYGHKTFQENKVRLCDVETLA